MSRKLITALVSSALIFSSISTSAWSANEAQRPVQVLAVQTSNSTNEMPLPPGPAAGVQEAQGVVGTGLILIGVLSVAAIVAVLLLVDDDEDEASSTGTN
jgi:hypothetical protein